MGIPSYFSYIVKNHPDIIKKLVKDDLLVDNFFLDCNSIIYDIVHNLKTEEIDQKLYHYIIIQVIQKIEYYISIIAPNNLVYIAFDGVAPVAKLEQQRERRYKSWYQGQITKQIFKKTTIDPFNTSSITPGTDFMNELNTKIKKHFENISNIGVKKIIVSGSDEFGEGEHKLFDYIRNSETVLPESVNVIYGLDADLIMLSINHLPERPNIYLFRETPHFIQNIDNSLKPNENYIMDIPELTKCIVDHMSNELTLSIEQRKNVIYDYIFICFFLGNDFMPHFPSINIRTGGVDKMLNAYKATIGGTNDSLTDGKTIYWKNVRKMVNWLIGLEEKHWSDEMKLRQKREKVYIPEKSPEDIFKKFENIPTYQREVEKIIDHGKNGWQKRYYQNLFDMDSEIDDARKKQICVNYLEGLEWTMKYYSGNCPDWRWCYKYNYPPLLEDLIHHIPYFEQTFIGKNENKAVTPLTQLCYVLPRPALSLLPGELSYKLITKHGDLYRTDYEFTWAFCKYFWEAHVNLPEINIEDLENFLQKI